MKDLMKSIEASSFLLRIFNSSPRQIDLISGCIEQLKDIDKKTAVGALQTLPYSVFPISLLQEDNITQYSLISLAGIIEYGSIYHWFQYWDNPLEYSLKDLKYVEYYEKRALESKARYELIKGIKSKGEQPRLSAACLWLLCEAARYWKGNIGSLGNEPISKRKYYENNQEVNEALEDINRDVSVRQVENLPDLYHNFDIHIETIARNLARDFPDFDSNYYVPYFKAKKTFNRTMRSKEFALLAFGNNPRRRKPNHSKIKQ